MGGGIAGDGAPDERPGADSRRDARLELPAEPVAGRAAAGRRAAGGGGGEREEPAAVQRMGAQGGDAAGGGAGAAEGVFLGAGGREGRVRGAVGGGGAVLLVGQRGGSGEATVSGWALVRSKMTRGILHSSFTFFHSADSFSLLPR